MTGNINFNSSVHGVQPTETPAISGENKVMQKPLEQETHKVSVESFKTMNAELKDIKNNRDVVFKSGKSAPDASCRHLSGATQEYIAASNSFQAQVRVGKEAAQDNSAGELPKTLAAVAKGVDSGTVSQQDGAQVLLFGKKQAELYTEWGQSVKNFIGENENKLAAANSKNKPLLEANIRQAKEVLSQIEPKAAALKESLAELKNSLISKYGKDTPQPSTPIPHANSQQAYRLVRLR